MSDDTLLDMARAIGRIEGKIDTHMATVATHIGHDEVVAKAIFERIEALQVSHASQRGGIKMLAAIGTAVGGLVGSVVTYVLKHSA